MQFATTFLALFAVLPAALAHGSISSITANGKTYTGPEPAEGNPFKQTSTPVRQLEFLEPIVDLSSKDMICGRGLPPKAELVADVAAGSKVSFTMRGGGGGVWPHEYGPIMFYLAKCPVSADKCDQSNLKFFKVDQLGLKPGQDNSWWQNDLYEGNSVSGTIPAGIESGNYLLRIEVMALHNAMNVGGAETSVACTQIRVTGGGNAVPPASDLVTFPGAYAPTDKGIHVDIWNGLRSYSFPGPKVFAATGGDPAPAPSSSAASKPTPSAPVNAAPKPTSNKPTSSSAAPVPSKTCSRSRLARHRRRAHSLVRDLSSSH